MNKTVRFILVNSFAILVAAPALAQTDHIKSNPSAATQLTADGKPLQLTRAQTEKILQAQKEGTRVYFPTFVPPQFSLKEVKLSKEDETQKHPDYQLVFSDKKNLTFSIETASSGIGDGPDGSRTIKTQCKAFGPVTIDVFKPGSEGNCTKNIYYLSRWMTEPKGKNSEADIFYHFLGEGLTDKEATGIVESLALVAPGIASGPGHVPVQHDDSSRVYGK